MTDPQRLSAREDFGGDLLRSAREDLPTGAARRRTAVALGLAVGATAAGTTAAVTASAAPASKLGTYGGVALLVKWIGVGAVGTAMAVGTVSYVAPTLIDAATRTTAVSAPASSARTRPHASPPAPARAPREAPSPASPPEALAVDGPSAPSSVSDMPIEAPPIPPPAAPLPIAPIAPVAPIAPLPRATAGTARPSSLADEVSSLDGAEAALAAGDPRRALDALDAHDREFKGGALSQEADVLRIDALAASRNDAAAAARARTFLAAFPDGAQASHVRSVLSAIESKKKL